MKTKMATLKRVAIPNKTFLNIHLENALINSRNSYCATGWYSFHLNPFSFASSGFPDFADYFINYLEKVLFMTSISLIFLEDNNFVIFFLKY